MRREKVYKAAVDEKRKSVATIELVHSGEDYFFRLLHVISNAQSEIHLQTYIFENDSTGLEITKALKEAVNRNVKVYVLLDGYGSAKLPNSFFEDLIHSGIHIRLFSPWYSKNNFYLGRRLHHKVVVVDSKIAIIGGINIANKYRGSSAEQAWLDYAVQIEDTSIAEPLRQLCKNIYLKKIGKKRKRIQSDFYNEKGSSVKIIRTDWLKRKNEIYFAYINALRNADKEVIIVESYFLPGRRLSKELKRVAKRGVKIKIILSSISDLPIVTKATQHLYIRLLKQGIELFEWGKSVLHGKLALVDAKWATVGSFNLNHLSSYGSIEMNVEINSRKFSEKLHIHLTDVIEQSEQIIFETHKMRNGICTRFKNWFAYRLVRIALIIVTYIPYKRFFK